MEGDLPAAVVVVIGLADDTRKKKGDVGDKELGGKGGRGLGGRE